jgi:hypothetical protein
MNTSAGQRVNSGMLRLALIPLALALTGCVAVDFDPTGNVRESFHYSYDLQPGGRVSIDNSNGAVEVSGSDLNRVEIDGEKYASSDAMLKEVRIDIRNQPDLVEIRTVRPSNSGFFSNNGARYTIRLPRAAKIERIATSNGRIDIRDLDAGARLRTSNGRIHAERIRGGVEAQTSNGRIELSQVEGAITGKTSNGPISIAMNLAPKDNIRAETSNGSITVRLPRDASARVEASTSNSGVTSDFDLTGHVRMDSNHISGEIGKGGPMLDLHTSNGHISLTRD